MANIKSRSKDRTSSIQSSINLKNKKFENTIDIGHHHSNYSIETTFNNCSVRKLKTNGESTNSMRFNNCFINELILERDQTNNISTLIFTECSINKITIVNYSSLTIEFIECTCRSFRTLMTNSLKVIFTGKINHLNLSGKGTNFSFSNYETVTNKYSNCDSMVLDHHFHNIKIKAIKFEELEVKTYLNGLSQLLELSNCWIVKIKLEQFRINKIAFYDTYVGKQLRFTKETIFDQLELKINNPSPRNMKIWMRSLSFNGLNNWDSIKIYGYKIRSLNLREIYTSKDDNRLQLTNSVINSIKISDSILDQTIIDQVDLQNANVKIQNSSLINISLHSIIWQKGYKILESDDYYNLIDNRETYRQLKVLALKINNKIDANFFQNSELRIYYKLLTIETFRLKAFPRWLDLNPLGFGMILTPFISVWNFLLIPLTLILIAYKNSKLFLFSIPTRLKSLYSKYIIKSSNAKEIKKPESKFNNYSDWLLLHTNKLFSDFGQSFFRPFFWLIGIHGFLYYLLIRFNDVGVEFISYWDRDAFENGLKLYLTLINPVHSGNIEGLTKDIIGLPIDTLMRISSGYFIYYFLKATRKMHFSGNV